MSAETASKVSIRTAVKDDCAGVMKLIRDLAEFEELTHQLKMTAEVLEKDGFTGSRPFFECMVAEKEGEIVGYAIYYYTYSTFQGKSLYLEDFYVIPSLRNQGIGTRFLRAIAQVAVDNNCARMDFIVLGWNKKAQELYLKFGAEDLYLSEKWHLFRFGKEQLQNMCQE